MKQTVNPNGKERLLDDLDTVVAETEQLLQSVASLAEGKAGALKDGVDEALASMGERIARIRAQSAARASAAVRAADDYVRDSPWRAMGIVALAAAAAGFVAAVVITRRP